MSTDKILPPKAFKTMLKNQKTSNRPANMESNLNQTNESKKQENNETKQVKHVNFNFESKPISSKNQTTDLKNHDKDISSFDDFSNKKNFVENANQNPNKKRTPSYKFSLDDSEEELIEGLISGKQQSEEAVQLTGDDDYVEIDGIKFTPFSMKKESEEGEFDKYGSYHSNGSSDDDKSTDDDNDNSSDATENNSLDLKKALSEIIPLIKPQNMAEEAIYASSNDNDRLIKLTDAATSLLYLGKSNIYRTPVADLEAELKSLEK